VIPAMGVDGFPFTSFGISETDCFCRVVNEISMRNYNRDPLVRMMQDVIRIFAGAT